MKKETPKGMLVSGSFRKAGMTFYMKQGQMIARVSKSREKRSNTLGQFVQRQKMRHTVALWQMLNLGKPMFTQRNTAYQNFASLANRLAVVYVPKTGPMIDASLLMPDIPVSDGTLPVVKQRLGDSVLLTNLKAGDLKPGEELVLHTAMQRIEGRTPRVRFAVRKVALSEMVEVDGCLALEGEEFADEMKGWALVRVNGNRCSTQGIVTRCTYYQQFTTDEALKVAAASYGGLTD